MEEVVEEKTVKGKALKCYCLWQRLERYKVMWVGEREQNFWSNTWCKRPSSPPKRVAHGALTIFLKGNSLWMEISKLSSKSSISSKGERNFLKIKRLNRRIAGGHPSEASVSLDNLLPRAVYMVSYLHWTSKSFEFVHPVSPYVTLSHLSYFFFNFNSVLLYGQHSCYI